MAERVDAHCHLWKIERGDYGWLDPDNPVLAPIARDFDLADLRQADPECADCARILVQAAPTVEETMYLLDIAEAHEDVSGVVGWVDLSDPSAAKALHLLARRPAFRGVRPMLQDIPEVDWIITRPAAGALAAMAELDLTFDALVLPQHLDPLLKFASANPDLAIVIDHGAKPALAADTADPRHEMWRDGMARLAKETRACCKLSGLLTELAPAQLRKAKEILRPVVDDLLEWFGPARLMWGSDWPVVNLAGSIGDWRTLSAELLSDLGSADQKQIYANTARAFYGLGEAA